jgi:5-oxoprolinase (ATP-hydrolysing) subunit A
MRAAPFGDEAVEIVASDAAHARRIARALSDVAGVREAIVGWDRVVAYTDGAIDVSQLVLADEDPLEGALHVVRAVYDGPDLGELADACSLSVEEVIERHTAVVYTVEVIGFLPGFAYLGGVDPAIARPRRPSPRPRVDALSIGIAGDKTAIYPHASPGGWNLIARAVDFAPFDPSTTPPCRFAVGDRVRFARC